MILNTPDPDSNYQYLKRVTIEANNEFPSGFVVQYDSDPVDDPFNILAGQRTVNKRMSIIDIRLDHWTVKFEKDYVTKFRKVADIVGVNLAPAVLKALDL